MDSKIIIDKIKEAIKTMSRKKLYVSSFVALAVIVVSIFLLGKKEAGYADMTRKEEPLTVTAVTVEPEIVDAVVSAAGALNSKNTSVLSSKVMGKVSYLSVQEGDHVAQGKLLMKIDSGEIAAQAYQAQAAYNNAKLQYSRIKTLYDEKASTQMEMDQATLGLETAEAGLKAAKAMESYTIITAPISGQVVEKKINLGEMALPGQPILKIEDNRNLRLEVMVNEQDLRYIQPGVAVRVQIDAMPEKAINARVAQVVPASDIRTHSFVAKIDIPAEKGLITGMYGKAIFTTGKRQAILVPRSAVVTMSGLSGAYIVSPEGNATFQMVQLGEVHGERIEALTGLKAGDKVIINKQEARIEGRKVVLAENGK
jgi:RND family efflux transporter MFP subunit